MYFWAGSKILFRVGEEIMRTGTGEVRTADFRVCDRELGIATLSTGANELVGCEKRSC